MRHWATVSFTVFCSSCALVDNANQPWPPVASFPDFRAQVAYAESGEPAVGVEVCSIGYFTWPGGLKKLGSATTNADGKARMSLVDPQNYRIRVDAPAGYFVKVVNKDFSHHLNHGYVDGQVLNFQLVRYRDPPLDGYGEIQDLNACGL